MVRENLVQSQVMLYQRLYKWYLIPLSLTLSNIRYVSRVKWSNLGKGVVPSPISWWCSYWKGSLLVVLHYFSQLYIYLISVTSLSSSTEFLVSLSLFMPDQFSWAVHYADWIEVDVWLPLTSGTVLFIYVILNYPVVRLRFWRSGECGVPPHYQYS